MMALRACSVLRTNKNIFSKGVLPFVRCLHGPGRENEYSEVPLYPCISPHKDQKEANVARIQKKMAKLGTVEEKQYFLNEPKYYGWYSYQLSEGFIPPDCREFVQFATQTHVVQDMPDYYK